MRYTSLIILLSMAFIGCDSMGDKAGKLKEKAEKSIAETYAATEDVIDRTKEKVNKLMLGYDADKPDTENNRNHFFDYLKVKPGKDVKDLYTYGNYRGIDYKVLIAFKADKATIDSIISIKELKLSTEEHDHGLMLKEQFHWWDNKTINGLQPYKRDVDAEHCEYLWYDHKTGKAWYLEFSL